VQKALKLKIAGASDEDWLGRFVRTLEVGQRRARRWTLRPLDHTVGWEARADLADRTERITLLRHADEEWTLTVESGPPERAPARLPGGEWLVGFALGLAAFDVARRHIGDWPAVGAGLFVLMFCGLVLPDLIWRRAPVTPGDEPDDVDSELLDRVRRGAEAFVGFEVLSPEWGEPDLP
jgi:hypothetical protein